MPEHKNYSRQQRSDRWESGQADADGGKPELRPLGLMAGQIQNQLEPSEHEPPLSSDDIQECVMEMASHVAGGPWSDECFWLVKTYAPAWLELAGLHKDAVALRALLKLAIETYRGLHRGNPPWGSGNQDETMV